MSAESTVAEIETAGGAALGIAADVRDHRAVEAMVARVVEEWGRVDVLVANAGGGRGRPVDTKASTIDPALLEVVVEMNLFGTVYCCNAVGPIMKRQRSGKIVTVSSVAGVAPSADGGYAHYGAAKAAVAHYTRYLAQDLGPYGSQLCHPGGHRHRADHADGSSGQRRQQSQPGGTGGAAAPRLG